MLELIASPQAWLALPLLFLLELVLGVDNIVFLSIIVNRLPKPLRERARVIGLALAMVTRIGLLYAIVWLVRLSRPWFHFASVPVSVHSLVLVLGGLFLLANSVLEIHRTLRPGPGPGPRPGQGTTTRPAPERPTARIAGAVAQAALIDIVFSLDSVLTAVALTSELWIMVTAIVLAMLVMLYVSRSMSAFIERFPTFKILALGFLTLIGFALIGQALKLEIPMGYLYFAIAFSAGIELINVRLRPGRQPAAETGCERWRPRCGGGRPETGRARVGPR